MFDNFLSTLKSQTTQLSASFSDLRKNSHVQGRQKSSASSQQLTQSPNLLSKSQSHYSMNCGKELKWPVLVDNERQWVSSSSLDLGENRGDAECETVFRNPAHDLRDEDSEEECLIDKFDRASVRNHHRRNDREEIRRRLAMGVESDDTSDSDKIAKKPSLHSRLQSGMNLQICFMNETASDGSDSENHKDVAPPESKSDPYISLPVVGDQKTQALNPELDFFTKQAKLQTEARTALTQAKELARVQMQVERQQRKRNRISDLLGIPFPWECRRLSRQILTEMNIAQLQVIVNDLHTQIEGLNEELVQMLLKRDDCHMEQDSMLVDIEDLTRYLTAKQLVSETGPASLPVQKSSRNKFRIPGLRK